jgi:hypothetical protein
LRSLLGSGIMLYTKTEDGRFIPVWQEETWWLCQIKQKYL